MENSNVCGEWFVDPDTKTHFCSECGKDALFNYINYNNNEFMFKEVLSNFCPHCGVGMLQT